MRGLLAAIVAVRLALGVAYSIVVPPWESHDETGHYAYVHYVAANRALPPVGAILTPWFDESHQPPLYYLLTGLAGTFLAPSEPPRPAMNPFFLRGDLEGGVNAAVHDPQEEAFPYRGHYLLLHFSRVISAIFASAAVLIVYWAGREAFPGRDAVALAGAALAAFTPGYLFVGSSVNNDALVPLVGGLVLLAATRVARGDASWHHAALLGLFLGLALLTKNSALAFIPFSAAAIVLGLWRRRARPGEVVQWTAMAFGTAAAVAGWWYARNFLAVGRLLVDREPTNPIFSTLSPFFESLGKASPVGFLPALAYHTFRTYWGIFGWGNVVAPDSFYLAMAVLSGLALLGAAIGLRRGLAHSSRERPRVASTAPDSLQGVLETKGEWTAPGLLVLFLVLTAALPLYRAVYFNTPTLLPGRYLFPAIAAIGPLMAFGLGCLFPGRLGTATVGLACLALLTAATALLPATISPAYMPPARMTEEEARAASEEVFLDFDHRLALVGYRADQRAVRPGESVEVTLVWKALDRMSEDYTVGVHVVDSEFRSLGQLDRYPGRGNYATSLWKPGDLFAETYRVPVSPKAQVPGLARFRLVVHRYVPDPPDSATYRSVSSLPAFDRQGQRVNPAFGELKLLGQAPVPAGLEEAHFRLGSAIELSGYRLSSRQMEPGRSLRLVLLWSVREAVRERYVVFTHLLDAAGRVVAQQDSEPRGASYPTHLWEAGETIPDNYELAPDSTLPPGEYTVEVGMYRRDDLSRLPVMDGLGQRVEGDRVLLGTVMIEDRK